MMMFSLVYNHLNLFCFGLFFCFVLLLKLALLYVQWEQALSFAESAMLHHHGCIVAHNGQT